MIIVTSKYFRAAVILKNNRVVKAAPILKYMKGWSKEQIIAYCQDRKMGIRRTTR
jgi:hypothetical protein